MASGKSHDKACFYAGIFVASASIVLLAFDDAISLVSGFAIGSIWLSPDIDLKQSRPSQRLGFLSLFWKPYRKASGHRGFSHLPIIGTASRLIYIGLLVSPLMAIALTGQDLRWDMISFLDRNFLRLIDKGFYLFVGLEASAWVHLLMDYCPGLRRT